MPESKRDALLYAVLPVAVGLGFVGMYFSGVGWLQSLAAPELGREYGLVENLQNAMLIATCVVAARAARRTSGRGRLAWGVIFLGSALVFLEEIDFGLTYYEDLAGTSGDERAEVRNLHNQGNNVNIIKLGVDTGMALFFGLLPFLASRIRSERWRALVPSRFAILTLVIAVGTSKLAHWLEDEGWPNNGVLRSNISEFREMFVYWIWFLYFLRLAPGAPGPRVSAEDTPGDASR